MALQPKPIEGLRALPCGRMLLDALGASADVWVVGGAVRDLSLGRTPREIDLVTTGSAEAVGERLGDVVEKHERFGTVKVRAGDCEFDVAQTRSETYAAPGALPDVVVGVVLKDDLERRDFTVNAVVMALNGDVVEHPGAARDLTDGVMRVLHDGSFIDDPTRLWRLVRYSVRLGFTIERHTTELAAAAVAEGAIETISGDRIGAELRLALSEPDPLATLHAAQNLGLTPALDLDPAQIGVALEILPPDGRRDLMLLGAAVPDDRWIGDLGFTADDLAVVRACIGAPGAPEGEPSEIAAALRGLPDEAVALSGARGNRAAAERWLLELRHVKLEISGEDLLEAGVPKGPEIGERLARALAMKLDGKVNGRSSELAAALQ